MVRRLFIRIFFCLIFILTLCSPVLAETITLKSGEVVEGEIIEKNEDHIKVNVSDTEVTYFIDEIRDIDGREVSPAPASAYRALFRIRDDRQDRGSSSVVFVNNRQLWVKKRLSDGFLDRARAYIIRGVTWSPATAVPDTGPDPLDPSAQVPYGFFFDWERRRPQGRDVFIYWFRNQFKEHYLKDISLMKQMNVNTVRVYTDFGGDRDVYGKVLDEFYRNDIMVIVTVAAARADIDKKRYLQVVQAYKDYPAILMWSLGNEWNLEYNKYHGYASVIEAAQATNRMAAEIKKIDPDHPVCSVLGDRFTDPKASNTIAGILELCPEVDAWGLNVYRGTSFGNLFEQWRKVSSKPLFISEFGTDSFQTESYEITRDQKAYHCQGREDEEIQAQFTRGLWDEIKEHLSALDRGECCLGGLVHEFNDEIWKVGSYHASLGGLIDYKSPSQKRSYAAYDPEGFVARGSHPDNVSNEEYYGVVTVFREPKKIFFELQSLYKEMQDAER